MTSPITAEARAEAVHSSFFIEGTGDASLAAELKDLIASAIREAERDAEKRAIDQARHIVATARVSDGSSAEHMRRLLLAALDPRWDEISSVLKSTKETGHE